MDALSTSCATSAAKTNSIGVTFAPAFKKLATVATSITNLKKNDWGFHSISVRSNNGRRKALSVKVSAASKQLVGSLTKTEGFRFAVVIARFNEFITKPLLEGAMDGFRRHSVREEDVDVIWVPGSFEIPLTAQTVAKSGKYNAVLCIGAVIRGATTHYEAVANSAASGIVSSSLNSGVPCIFGVLTCDTMEQAIDRAGGKAGNKGYEAALTAIEMASLLEHHLKC